MVNQFGEQTATGARTFTPYYGEYALIPVVARIRTLAASEQACTKPGILPVLCTIVNR